MSETCKEAVWKRDRFRPSPCTRTATRDGYCTQHHPDTVAKRDAERSARWEAERKASAEARNAPIREALAARDAEWRASIEAVRREHTHPECVRLATEGESWLCSLECDASAHNAALDAVLARMEGR